MKSASAIFMSHTEAIIAVYVSTANRHLIRGCEERMGDQLERGTKVAP